MSADSLRRNIFELQPLEIRTLLTTAVIEAGGILHVIGGGGNDIIAIGGSGSAITVTGVAGTFVNANFTKIQIEGGDGNDTISIGSSVSYTGGSTINGNSGADSIIGAGQRDSLRGGTGNDTLLGGNQNDTLSGEDNNDFMDGGGGNDTINGGGGLDTANYSYRTGAVDADNDGVADDGEGALGENDNIATNVEEIIGGGGADTLTGGGNSDFLGGGAGNDLLTGNGGNDELTAGIGQDDLDGGSGDDALQAQNNDRDTVDGGTGNFDTAQVDTLDVGAREIFADGVVGNGASDLDSGYGGGDGLATGPDLGWNQINGSAVDAQGRVVFVGSDFNEANDTTDMVVSRYLANGDPDTDFGVGGQTIIDFSDFGFGYGTEDFANAVGFGSDGSMYVVGGSYEFIFESVNTLGAAIAKLDANGDIVTSFGDEGRQIVNIGSGYSTGGEATDVVVQSDGKVVMSAHWSGTMSVIRLLDDGSLDEDFTGDGIVPIPIDAYTNSAAIALQTISGLEHIVIGGTADDSSFAIARVTPAGVIDTSFDTDGIVTQAFSTNSNLYDLAVAPDGTIVAAGNTSFFTFTIDDSGIVFDAPNPSAGETQAVLATISTSGNVIATMGESSTDELQYLTYYGVTVDNAGRVVAVGEDNFNYIVARYNLADLTPDSAFAATNYVSIDLGEEGSDSANSVRVLTGGKIVVGGATRHGEGEAYGSALRLNGEPADPTQPNEGLVVNVEDFFNYDDLRNNPPFFANMSKTAQNYMLWQPDGNGVVRIPLDEGDNNVVIDVLHGTGKDKFTYVSVNVDGLAVWYDPASTKRIEIYALDGNDSVKVADKTMSIPLLVDGGAGNDVIEGGDSFDILIGGPGNDSLDGSQGRNILIGGTGTDILKGGQKEDLLIAGETSHDNDVARLLEIQAEWNSDHAFNQRLNFLRNGGGLNAGTILQASVTVFDDNATDIVDGQGNKDWIFVHVSGANADQLRGAQGASVFDLI